MRVRVETKRGFAFTNGTAGEAFSETSKYGCPVYATDDHTVADNSSSATRKCVGYFLGMESDGKVRVFVDAGYAYLVDALNALQLLTDTPASADALRDNIVASMLAGLL
jgi:ActR/RegA family two-component response regulator